MSVEFTDDFPGEDSDSEYEDDPPWESRGAPVGTGLRGLAKHDAAKRALIKKLHKTETFTEVQEIHASANGDEYGQYFILRVTVKITTNKDGVEDARISIDFEDGEREGFGGISISGYY